MPQAQIFNDTETADVAYVGQIERNFFNQFSLHGGKNISRVARFYRAGERVKIIRVIRDPVTAAAEEEMVVGADERGADADGIGHYIDAEALGQFRVRDVGADE